MSGDLRGLGRWRAEEERERGRGCDCRRREGGREAELHCSGAGEVERGSPPAASVSLPPRSAARHPSKGEPEGIVSCMLMEERLEKGWQAKRGVGTFILQYFAVSL